MIRINSLKLNINHKEQDLRNAVLKRLRISDADLIALHIVKKSLDARKKDDIFYVYSVDAETTKEQTILKDKRIKDIAPSKPVLYNDPVSNVPYSLLSDIKQPVIVGFGPAGMFCAYKLAAAGLKPIVIERGCDVDTRIKDVNRFWQTGNLNPNSNVQFGEGGAGTFSDGKLNTLIHDNFGRIKEVFNIFIENGADESISYLNKPHIGTDRLTIIVKKMREYIKFKGGEIFFNSCLTDINIVDGKVRGITVNNSQNIFCDTLVLAIGHSARDTFEKLLELNIPMEKKAFAAGVRIQHPQALIGYAQYKYAYKELPAADYKLTYKTQDNRGVYSFCMCPGGFVVNASSEEGRLAVNGMSNSDRSEITANSALVVTVNEDDFDGESVLAGMELQRKLEEKCYIEGKGKIPVQYLCDFKINKATEVITENAPNTKGSYIPGNLNNVLPSFITNSLKEAFPAFGKTIKGFDDNHALLLGLESRTSSPVKIIRDESLQSIGPKGLYPCGEGAGYAGGITSAAVDGIKVYEAIINNYINRK